MLSKEANHLAMQRDLAILVKEYASRGYYQVHGGTNIDFERFRSEAFPVAEGWYMSSTMPPYRQFPKLVSRHLLP